MTAQQSLFAPAPARPAAAEPRRHFLGGLDPSDAFFVRKAAARIVALDTARDIDAALREVPSEFVRFVETLTVSGLALRVARALHPRIKEVLLAEVPDMLRPRVEPLAKSYAQVRPWEKRE